MKIYTRRILILTIVMYQLSICYFFVSPASAQVPTVQDCLGAIPVCQDVYVEDNSFLGSGNYPNEIFNPSGNCENDCPGSCLDGEQNSVWYVFTVQQAGILRLTIDPQDDGDDYDWAIYDITALRCDQIYSQYPLMQKSCNAYGASGYNGPTGISTPMGGSGNCNHCGQAGTNIWNADLNVIEGRTYVLIVENWGDDPTDGYTLDFSASTAVIYDNVRPELLDVHEEEISCGVTEVICEFSENVMCESVDPSDFVLSGPGGPYTVLDVQGQTCMLGGEMERIYTLIIDKPISADGDYSLQLIPMNFVYDACNNFALGNTITFSVALGAPEIDESGLSIQTATCGLTNGSITGLEVTGNPPFTYRWTDQTGALVGTTLDLLNVSSGNYYFEVTDPNTCETTSGPYFVDQVGAPVFNDDAMTITSATYGANNGSITGITVTGTPPLSYEWTDPYYVVVGTSLDLTNVYSGIYELRITDAYGCDTIAGPYFVPEVGGPVVVTATSDPGELCIGESSQLNALSSGGTGVYTFSWTSTPPGFISDIQSPVVFPTMTTTYHVSISDGYNIAESSVTVTVNPLPISDAGSDQTIPYGTSTTIYGSAGGGSGTYNYIWEPAYLLINPSAQNPATKNLYQTTVFELYVIDAITGCISLRDEMVVMLEGGALGITLSAGDDTICTGEETTITAFGFGGNFDDYTYTWKEGTTILKVEENTTSEITIAPVTPGNHIYTVEIFDLFNTFTSEITINVAPSPQFSILKGPLITACPLDSVVLEPSSYFPGAEYYWSNGSVESSITVGTTGIGFEIRTIDLTITNAEGCSYTDTVMVIFDFASCSAISETAVGPACLVYPNPTTGELNIKLLGENCLERIDIMDMQGALIRTDDPRKKIVSDIYSVDLSIFSPGIYFLKLTCDQNVWYHKVVLNER